MLKIGLTGGIGAGKSTVSDIFASLGVPVIDADVVSREVMQPGSKTLSELARILGSTILAADGSLRRDKLKQLIFDRPEIREQVESVVHPEIKREMLRQISTLQAPYCVLVVPLLIEKHWDEWLDRVLVVDAPEALRVQRVQARDNLDSEKIQQILVSQATQAERLRKADDIIINDGDVAQVTQQVKLLHNKYNQHAQSP